MNKCGPMLTTLTHDRHSREAKNKIALETIDPFSQTRDYITGRNIRGKEELNQFNVSLNLFTNKINPISKFE